MVVTQSLWRVNEGMTAGEIVDGTACNFRSMHEPECALNNGEWVAQINNLHASNELLKTSLNYESKLPSQALHLLKTNRAMIKQSLGLSPSGYGLLQN